MATNREKLKYGVLIGALLVCVWMITPMGAKSLHNYAVSGARQGGGKGWMSLLIFISRMTLRAESTAEYLRESYLLWPREADATQKLFDAAEIWYDLGVTADKSSQNRLLTRAYDVFSRLQAGIETNEILIELENGEKKYPLKLTAEMKTTIEKRLEYLYGHANRSFGEQGWSQALLDSQGFPDRWESSKIR